MMPHPVFPFCHIVSFQHSAKQRERREQAGEKRSSQGHHGDLGVDGGACRILEGIAHGIAGDGGLVRV